MTGYPCAMCYATLPVLKFVLVTLPCALWDLWWTLYRLALAVLVMLIVTLTVLVLLLDSVGVRWGW